MWIESRETRGCRSTFYLTPPVVLRNVVGSFLRGDWTSKRGSLDQRYRSSTLDFLLFSVRRFSSGIRVLLRSGTQSAHPCTLHRFLPSRDRGLCLEEGHLTCLLGRVFKLALTLSTPYRLSSTSVISTHLHTSATHYRHHIYCESLHWSSHASVLDGLHPLIFDRLLGSSGRSWLLRSPFYICSDLAPRC